MNRTSRITERTIIELHFQGDSLDAIAAKVGVPRSTVSEVLKLLPLGLAYLRELAVDCKKYGLSIFDAKKGDELRIRMLNLGFGIEELQSFVETAEKICTNREYEPPKVVRAAMRLSELEKESGKSYLEVLADFEEKKDNVKTLETEKRELIESICALKAEQKRMLTRCDVTEERLAYVVNLKQRFSEFGVKMHDAAVFEKYLENMRETGADPRKFLRFTEKHGSLEKDIALLEQTTNQKKLGLRILQEEEKNTKKAIDALHPTRAELNKQVEEKRKTLMELQEEINEREEEKNQKLATLGLLLEVEPIGERIVDVLGTRQMELEKLNANVSREEDHLQNLRQQAHELEDKTGSLRREIQDTLGIQSYTTQLNAGIAALENRKLALEKEVSLKGARIAMVDALTNFLLHSPYDFDQFCLYFELLKRLKAESSQPSIHVFVLEEEIRNKALKAFEGHLMTKQEQSELLIMQEKQKEAIAKLTASNRELQGKLDEANKRLESASNNIRMLEAMKTNFQARTITLQELRNWVWLEFKEEIQRRADKKFNMYAAAVYGALDFTIDKMSRKDSPKRSE